MVKQIGSLYVDSDGFAYIIKKGKKKIRKTRINEFGKLVFRSPDDGREYRLDYFIAMLFLNDGVFLEKISEYYIEHLDGDMTNCKLENLELITDPEEVSELRFDYLKDVRGTRETTAYFVADRYKLTVEVLTLGQVARKYDVCKSSIPGWAEKGTRLKSDTDRYWIFDNYLDAWDAL